jgi:hypothetical protein
MEKVEKSTGIQQPDKIRASNDTEPGHSEDWSLVNGGGNA